MIELKDVSKSYGNFLATNKVSFSVSAGEIIGLLGANGAGKTTIMKIITGYHNPHEGEVIVCGKNVLEKPVEIKKHIGYLPETNPLYDDLLVHEYLSFIAQSRNIPSHDIEASIDRVVDLCSLQEFVFKSITDLSKGMRQRVGLAQALIHDPDVLILDEPTSGLDPNQIKEIRSVIKEIGKTKAVILSTHILQEVEALCDRVLIINRGELVAEGTDSDIADQLKGMDIHTLVLVGSLSEDKIMGLSNLQGVSKVVIHHENTVKDCTTVTIESHTAQIEGEHIFTWVNAQKLTLRSLKKTSASLESIFETLTAENKEFAS